MLIERTSAEIGDLYDEAIVRANEPSAFPGLTYEEGVRDALAWITSKDAPTPLEAT